MNRKLLYSAFTVLSAIFLLALMGCLLWELRVDIAAVRADSNSIEQRKNFVYCDHCVSGFYLFDLGVVDANNDGYLDVYTTNHDSEQTLALNDGLGFFTENSFDDVGLSQCRDFAGIEPTAINPKPAVGKVAIFWQQEPEIALVVQDHRQSGDSKAARCRLKVVSESVKAEATGPSAVSVLSSRSFSGGFTESIVDLVSMPGGRVEVKIPPGSVPIIVELGPSVQLENFAVGRLGQRPSSSNFTLELRDRHGMAWADLDGDSLIDVYITRGGLKGKIKKYPKHLGEELFIGEVGGGFSSREISETKDISGRQVAFIDFDADGDLDLSISSGKGIRGKVLRQVEPMVFEDCSSEIGLHMDGEGPYKWLHLDDDNYTELIKAIDGRVAVYRKEGEVFSREDICDLAGVNSISAADLEFDLDLDVFIASSEENCILYNDAGRLSVVAASSLGLPDRSYVMSPVDFDNDGNLDVFCLPQGVYRQKENGMYEATGDLKWRDADGLLLWQARANWFDADNDGDMDVIMSVQKRFGARLYWRTFGIPESSENSEVSFFKNQINGGHWLQVDLDGKAPNTSAIGSRVVVRSGGKAELQQVGQVDGAKMGMGHHRLYFGLGNVDLVDNVTVLWANGETTELMDVPVDQRLSIRQ